MKHKKTKHKKLRHREFPVAVFAFVLVAVVFLEGAMLGVTTGADLSEGMKVLDISEFTVNTKADMKAVFDPLVTVVAGVNEFYMMATDATMSLLDDNIVNNISLLIEGVNDFYKSAATELANALDLSDELMPQSAFAEAY